MYDYSYVLALLHAHAAEQRSRALLCQQPTIANATTIRTLRNRAKLICERALELPASKRDQFIERAVRHL